MPASTAPEAKRRIIVLLNARPNLASTSVTWGGPTKQDDVTDEMVYLTGVEFDGEWRILGAGQRDEDYTISLVVDVQRYGSDPQPAEERAWALLDEVSAALRSDSTLGGLLLLPSELAGGEQTNAPTSPEQMGARIEARIHCQARFDPKATIFPGADLYPSPELVPE